MSPALPRPQPTLIRSGRMWWAVSLPQGRDLGEWVGHHVTARELNPASAQLSPAAGHPLSPGLLAAAGVSGPWNGQPLRWQALLDSGSQVSWEHLPGLSPQEQRANDEPLSPDIDLSWNVHPTPPGLLAGQSLAPTEWLRQWLSDARSQLQAGWQLLNETGTHTPEISDELLAALSLPTHLALLQEEAHVTGLKNASLSLSAPVVLSLLRALACADELARLHTPLSINRRVKSALRLSRRPQPLPHLLLTLTRAATQWTEQVGARDHAAYSSQLSLWLLGPNWVARTVTWTARRWWALRRHGMPTRQAVDEQLISDWLPSLASLPLDQATRDWRLKATVRCEVNAERFGLSGPAHDSSWAALCQEPGIPIPASVRPPRPWPRPGQSEEDASAEALELERRWGQEASRPWDYSPLRPNDIAVVRGQARGEIERLLHAGQDGAHVAPHWLLKASVPACFMPPPSELHAQAKHFVRSGGVVAPRALKLLSHLALMWSEHTCLHAGLDALAPLAEAEERCARQIARLSGRDHLPSTRPLPLTPPICLSDTDLWELEDTYTHTGRTEAAFGLDTSLN